MFTQYKQISSYSFQRIKAIQKLIIMEMKDLPKFSHQTKIFVRGSKDYDVQAYQYGTTSHQEGSMSPAGIICPRDIDDIKKRSITHASMESVLLYVLEDINTPAPRPRRETIFN